VIDRGRFEGSPRGILALGLRDEYVARCMAAGRGRLNPRLARGRWNPPAILAVYRAFPRAGPDDSRAILCQLAAGFQPAAPVARERGHGRGRRNPPARSCLPHASRAGLGGSSL